MQRLEGLMRKAMQQYRMISPGDRVAVGVSGGKDSVALTVGLARLSRYYEHPFTVVALTLDPRFGGEDTDYSALTELFQSYGVEHVIKRSNIGTVIFNLRKEPNPCALCAKMRRGLLHDTALELGCNKVALGHHLDDAIETFYMNLFREGRIGCFSPVTYLSRKQLTMIRPMLLATEAEVVHAVNSLSLPIVKSRCPADGVTVRQSTKEFVYKMSREDRAFRQKMLGALQKSGIDGWGPSAPGRISLSPKEES